MGRGRVRRAERQRGKMGDSVGRTCLGNVCCFRQSSIELLMLRERGEGVDRGA